MQNILHCINNVLSIVVNIQNTTIFEPVILTGFYTSKKYRSSNDSVFCHTFFLLNGDHCYLHPHRWLLKVCSSFYVCLFQIIVNIDSTKSFHILLAKC